MKKNRMKFLIIEFLLLLLAVFFVWKIFDQNVAEPRIAVILPESGDKRWDALIKGMKQAAAENNVHMIICNTEEIDGPEVEREFIREQKDNDIDGFIIYPAPGHETENMLKKECGKKPYLLIADGVIDLISPIYLVFALRASRRIRPAEQSQKFAAPDEKKENKDDSESEKPVYTVKPTASTDENAGDELPEGDMDEMTKEILNFFEEDK